MAIDPAATPKDYSLIIYNKTEIDDFRTTNSAAIQASLASKSDKSDEGSPSGIATLDPAGKVSNIELPISTLLESIDPLNTDTLITPERMHYNLDINTVQPDQIGVANGVAPLGADALVPDVYLPATQNVQTFVVATINEMLQITTALTGDRTVVTSEVDPADNGEYVANIDYPTLITGWDLLPNLSAVQSVNTLTGNVTITSITESAANAVDIAAMDIVVGTNTADIATNVIAIDANATAIVNADGRITTNETNIATNTADITTLQAIPDAARLNPVFVSPAHVEGQFYYNGTAGTFDIQGPYPGITVSPGHGEHLHVVNNTGLTIPSGTPVRIAGTALGIPQIVPALADTFAHARATGYTVVDIPNATESAIAVTGIVSNIDTSLLPVGVPLYLSSTIAGGLTDVAPAIRTVIGGVLVQSATVGQIRLDIIPNQITPSVLGVMQGQAGAGSYALTATPVTVVDYASTTNIVTGTNITTGEITLPSDGSYRVHITADLTFAALASTRSITVELYDAVGGVHFPYNKSIPRDATSDAFSFSWVLPEELAGRAHSVRLSSADNFTITLTEISFDVTSIVIN